MDFPHACQDLECEEKPLVLSTINSNTVQDLTLLQLQTQCSRHWSFPWPRPSLKDLGWTSLYSTDGLPDLKRGYLQTVDEPLSKNHRGMTGSPNTHIH
jgi:hypothetical protein